MKCCHYMEKLVTSNKMVFSTQRRKLLQIGTIISSSHSEHRWWDEGEWLINERNLKIINPTHFHLKRIGIVGNKSNSPVNIRSVTKSWEIYLKTSDIRSSNRKVLQTGNCGSWWDIVRDNEIYCRTEVGPVPETGVDSGRILRFSFGPGVKRNFWPLRNFWPIIVFELFYLSK